MEDKKSLTQVFIEYVRVVVVTLVCTFVLLQFVQISKIVGSSMENTYFEGNIVLVDKFFYKRSSPEANDIVIVEYDGGGEDRLIIKRVIGVEGDHLEIKDNVLYINGTKVQEDYIKEPMETSDMSLDIPKGKVFVMGDNRNYSLDSREIGLFDFKDDIVGKVFYKVPLF